MNRVRQLFSGKKIVYDYVIKDYLLEHTQGGQLKVVSIT